MRNFSERITVPLIVDAVRKFNELEMVRFLYFSIETDLPLPGWHLDLTDFQIPIILVGLSAIIVTDSSMGNTFNSIKRIDDFFKTVENDVGLTVSTNDIWFPKNYLNEHPKPNSLFRVGLPLFLEAHKRRSTENSWEFDKTTLDKPSITFQPEETKAFLDWTRDQVEIVKSKSHEYPEKKLRNRYKQDDNKEEGGENEISSDLN